MAGVTNRGKTKLLDMALSNATEPTALEVHLVTSATAPTAAINTLSELTEIANGNGYVQTTGYSLTRNGTNFVTTEVDGSNLGKTVLVDVSWTASGGPIPASGNGARYAVLTTDDAGAANKHVLAWWDLGSDQTIQSGQSLTLQALEIDLTE